MLFVYSRLFYYYPIISYILYIYVFSIFEALIKNLKYYLDNAYKVGLTQKVIEVIIKKKGKLVI